MPNSATSRTLRGRSVLRAALFAALSAAVVAAPQSVRAEDTRPQQIRYDVPGAVPLLQPSYGRGRQVVLVTDDRLDPRRVKVRAGETLAWVSYARGLTVITFEREVARSMICHGLINFHLADDELRSGPMQTGDTASFCQLKPGVYRYRVEADAPENQHQLSSRLDGVIVVEGGNARR